MSEHAHADVPAERAVLGGILVDCSTFAGAAALLRAGDFARQAHRAVWSAMVSLEARGEAIDLVTLRAELAGAGNLEAAGGASYIAGLIDGLPRMANVDSWARLVAEKARLRELAARVHRLEALVAEDGITSDRLLTAAQAAFLDAIAPSDGGSFGPAELGHLASVALDALAVAPKGLTGIATGLPGPDAKTGGLQPGQYVAIGARPACGKTALAVQIADHAARCGHVAQFFSLEMTAQEIALRRVCAEAEIGAAWMRGAGPDSRHWPRLVAALSRLDGRPFYLEELTGPTASQIRARAKRLQAQRGLGVVVVDYVQYVRGVGKPENRNHELSAISRELKAMARMLHVPVVVVAQLNRQVEGRADRRPQLSDFRDCGSIEADADVAMLIWRKGADSSDPAQRSDSEIILAKHRNGPTGALPVRFNLELARFEDLAREETVA